MFVFGASARSGTTLLQRLFNSTEQIVVFSENTNFVNEITALVESLLLFNHTHEAELKMIRHRFMTETTEIWGNLWPDTNRYAQVLLSMFHELVRVHQDSAADLGRRRWGLKLPLTNPKPIAQLSSLLPGAKFIFTYRDIFKAASSAKARSFVKSPEQCAVMAARWQDNLLTVLDQYDAARLLPICYEDLVVDPEPWLAKLETFTGVGPMKREVMGRKINTFLASTQPGAAPGYIEPVPLTRAEISAIESAAPQAIARCGYRCTQQAA